ncbi:hypothetical protein HII31_04261 [Pseudocercospora fuligena]|uniref:DUF7605 domain-containing protein n=1 Tax=Pseudocercospora fuligena TaxID=685502 RepID=A0A8H6RNW5_9PEZI|nr:hypothetical protein HII31_04261 [Pseudocercospora fuligena]
MSPYFSLPKGLGKRKRDIKDDSHDDRSLFSGGRTVRRRFAIDSDGEIKIKQEPRDDDEETDRQDNDSDGADTIDGDEEYQYSEAEESFPDSPLYDNRLPHIKQRLSTIAEEAEKILAQAGCSTEDVQILLSQVKAVRSFPRPEPKLIGLVGNAGQGKSSLVNSLTDIPGLAKALDTGESVTWVPMIYGRPLPSQENRFAGQIEYLDLPSIGKLLVDATRDWQAYHIEKPANLNPDEEEELERHANAALFIYQTVFCDTEDFGTKTIAAASLTRLCTSNASTQQKTTSLIRQAEAVMAWARANNSIPPDFIDTDSKTELHHWLDLHTDPGNSIDVPSLWPFIKQVNVGVSGSRVLDSWTVADLPGLMDLNHVRINSALRTINACDHLWFFDQIGRMSSKNDIRKLVSKYGKPFKGRLLAIGTRSAENVSQSLVSTYARRGINIAGLKEYKEARAAAGHKLGGLKRSKKNLAQYNDTNSSHRSANIRHQIKELKQSIESLDDDWWAKVVQGRNKFVTRELQRQCQTFMPDGSPLKVFCVSNAHYMARKTGDRQKNFTLPIAATGIPALGAHALATAAPAAFKQLTDFVGHEFAVFLSGLALWSGRALTRGRAQLVNVISRPRGDVPRLFQNITRDVKTHFHRRITSVLFRRQDHFTAAASRVMDNTISPAAWSTWNAFLRRRGNWSTNKITESWNELLSEEVRNQLETNMWYPFTDHCREQIGDLQRQVSVAVESIMNYLKREPAAIGLPMRTFESALEAHVEGLSQLFTTAQDELERSLRAIILDVVNDGEDNYFAAAMKPAYDECLADYGRGVLRRWCHYFRRYLSRPGQQSPFHIMTEAIERDVHIAIEACMSQLQRNVDKIFEAITKDCRVMVNQQKNTTAEQPLRKAISHFLWKAIPKFEGIQAELAEIEEDYSGKAANFKNRAENRPSKSQARELVLFS